MIYQIFYFKKFTSTYFREFQSKIYWAKYEIIIYEIRYPCVKTYFNLTISDFVSFVYIVLKKILWHKSFQRFRFSDPSKNVVALNDINLHIIEIKRRNMIYFSKQYFHITYLNIYNPFLNKGSVYYLSNWTLYHVCKDGIF